MIKGDNSIVTGNTNTSTKTNSHTNNINDNYKVRSLLQ